MGCQVSKQENTEIVSNESEGPNDITYRELITQDRGHVFDLYHFSMIISRSDYSIVRKVQSRNSLINRICKIVPLLNKKVLEVISEVQYLKKLDHPNAVQIIQYFLQPSFLYIIFEDVQGNCILQELHKSNKWITFDHIVEIMRQILSVVQYCHKNLIAHRAITVDNILLTWRQKTPLIKLIDFSQAQAIDCPRPKRILASKRNIQIGEEDIQKPTKIDVFDCGIVFYEILMGQKNKLKRYETNSQKLIASVSEVINSLCLDTDISKNLKDMLSSMLDQNSGKRPSPSELLQNKFFKSFELQVNNTQALQNLLSFKGQGNLKYLLHMYASLNMTSSLEKTQYLTQFYNLDKNRDGEIQLQQLVQGIINTFGLSEIDARIKAEEMFRQLDKNNSGSLNFSEYVIGTMKLSKIFSQEFLGRMFKQIDLNKDGLISESQINNLISGIDRFHILQNKNQVDFKEFKKIMIKILMESQDSLKELKDKSLKSIKTEVQKSDRSKMALVPEDLP